MSCQCEECREERENIGDPFINNLTEEDFMQDNSWYEKGELPPVGAKVKYLDKFLNERGNSYKIIAHDEGYAVGRLLDDRRRFVYSIFEKGEVEPIKSDREKAIEEMVKISLDAGIYKAWDGTIKRISEILYDAGYRKADK